VNRGASNSQGPNTQSGNWELQEAREFQTDTWTLQGLVVN